MVAFGCQKHILGGRWGCPLHLPLLHVTDPTPGSRPLLSCPGHRHPALSPCVPPVPPDPEVALRAAPHLLGSPSSAQVWGCQSLPSCRHQQPPRTPLCWQPHPWAFLPPADRNLLLSSVLGADPHPGPLLSPFPCSAQLLGVPKRAGGWIWGCLVSLRGFTPHFFEHGAPSPCRRGVPHKPGGGGRQSCGDLGREKA